jgi:hypothetical protein
MDVCELPPPWLPKRELTEAQRAALSAIGIKVSPLAPPEPTEAI